MITSRRSALLPFERKQVWEIVLDVDHYKTWRSDVSHTEKINEKQFIEYSTQGIPTTFTVTAVQPYQRWEFDLDNCNIKGHWIGILIGLVFSLAKRIKLKSISPNRSQ